MAPRGAIDKGLRAGAIGLLSTIAIGVASTAPGYSLAAVLGAITGSGDPTIGWLGGWTIIIADLVVMPSLASIAEEVLGRGNELAHAAGVSSRGKVVTGRPVEGLIAVADSVNAPMIVVGHHGEGPLRVRYSALLRTGS